MPYIDALELVRIRAAASAQAQDAGLWRWFSDKMEERELECRRYEEHWSIRMAGRELACDRSFDAAIRAAYLMQRAFRAARA